MKPEYDWEETHFSGGLVDPTFSFKISLFSFRSSTTCTECKALI